MEGTRFVAVGTPRYVRVAYVHSSAVFCFYRGFSCSCASLNGFHFQDPTALGLKYLCVGGQPRSQRPPVAATAAMRAASVLMMARAALRHAEEAIGRLLRPLGGTGFELSGAGFELSGASFEVSCDVRASFWSLRFYAGEGGSGAHHLTLESLTRALARW